MQIKSKVNYNVVTEPGEPEYKMKDSRYGSIWRRKGQIKVKIKADKEFNGYNFDLTNRLVYDQLFALQQAKLIEVDPAIGEYSDVRAGKSIPKTTAKSGTTNKSRGKISEKLSSEGSRGASETAEKDGDV